MRALHSIFSVSLLFLFGIISKLVLCLTLNGVSVAFLVLGVDVGVAILVVLGDVVAVGVVLLQVYIRD